MGNPNYEVTEGRIVLDGEDITEADPDERARAGLFLAFQYPATIPGVSVANFLRMAVNAGREEPIKVKEFGALLRENVDLLKISGDFTKRYLNEGFSGGEKKRAEILQLAMLQPDVRGARRDRLGARHRRAADRLGRRQRDALRTSAAS